jgi:tetratricopeptide (TPR) repeat protein
LGRTRPLQGLTFGLPRVLYPPRKTMVPFLAGGIIANLLLMVGALALCRWVPLGRSLWLTAAAANALLAIPSLIPSQFKVGSTYLRNDGMLIVQTLRDRVISQAPFEVVQTLKALRQLWESIGDDATLRIYILGAAAVHCELEDFRRAEMLLAELDATAPSDPAMLQASDALVRCSLLGGTGRPDEANEALRSAESLFRASGDEVGLLSATMQRAWIHLLKHEATEAAVELESLTCHPLLQPSSWFQSYVYSFCVQAHAARSDPVGAEQALARYETARTVCPSALRDYRVYRVMTRLCAEIDDWVRAEQHCRRAFAAISELVGQIAHTDERSQFLETQAAFFDELRRCYQSLNRADEAERLIALLTTTEQIQQPDTSRQRQRDRRLLRAGLWLLLIDVCCSLGAIRARAFLEVAPWHPINQCSVLHVVGTIVVVVFLLFFLVIGLFLPGLRAHRGLMIFSIAWIPWGMVVFGLL